MNRKTNKKVILGLLVMTVMGTIGLIGCGQNDKASSESTKVDSKAETKVEAKKEETKPEEKKKEDKSKLDGLKEAYKEAGFTIGDNEQVAFEMLGAKSGYKFKVDNELIEIYEYDMNNLTEDAKKYVEQAKKGSITLSGFNVPVKFKDGLMLTRHNEHSKKDKIVEVFEKYK